MSGLLVFDMFQNSRWLQLGGARLATMTEGEKRIADILTKELEPTFLEVRDISGEKVIMVYTHN